MAGEPELKPGDSGEWVSYLQQCLNAFDMYSPIEESGTYDEATEGKVRFVQGTVGVPVTGIMESWSWEAMVNFVTARDGGQDAGSGDGGSEAAGDWKDPLPLDITVDLKPNGTVAITGGNPAIRIAAESQWLSAKVVFADGSDHSGWSGPFPSKALGPGESDTVEFDYAYATVEHGDQTGAKLRVLQLDIGVTVVGFDIVNGECQPTGEVIFEEARE